MMWKCLIIFLNNHRLVFVYVTCGHVAITVFLGVIIRNALHENWIGLLSGAKRVRTPGLHRRIGFVQSGISALSLVCRSCSNNGANGSRCLARWKAFQYPGKPPHKTAGLLDGRVNVLPARLLMVLNTKSTPFNGPKKWG